MILSRVAEHLKRHWAASLLDLAIVVVGVFLANQLSVWNEARVLHDKKVAATTRLHDESEAIVDYYDGRVARFERHKGLREDAMRRLIADDWRGADRAKITEAFDSFGIAPAASPPRSAYDELISSGLFADLGDARLRGAVADYYASLTYLQGQIEYIRSGIASEGARGAFAGVKPVFDPKAFRDLRTDYDFEALSKDRNSVAYAAENNADELAQLGWWTSTLKKARAMCAEISRFDGRPCEVGPPEKKVNLQDSSKVTDRPPLSKSAP